MKKNKFLLIVLAITTSAIILAGCVNKNKIADEINSFEKCKAAGGVIMETYPEQCAINGQTFTQEFSEEEQEKLVPPEDKEVKNTNQTNQLNNETADWQTYRNAEYGFEFKYPPAYKIVTDEEGWPNAVALLMPKDGSQAYYAQVEVWDKESDFKNDSNHPHDPTFIVQSVSKLITFNYVEDEEIMEKIIATFKCSTLCIPLWTFAP